MCLVSTKMRSKHGPSSQRVLSSSAMEQEDFKHFVSDKKGAISTTTPRKSLTFSPSQETLHNLLPASIDPNSTDVSSKHDPSLHGSFSTCPVDQNNLNQSPENNGEPGPTNIPQGRLIVSTHAQGVLKSSLSPQGALGYLSSVEMSLDPSKSANDSPEMSNSVKGTLGHTDSAHDYLVALPSDPETAAHVPSVQGSLGHSPFSEGALGYLPSFHSTLGPSLSSQGILGLSSSGQGMKGPLSSTQDPSVTDKLDQVI